MNHHDTRGEYDRIARYLEECETEIPWEEIMKSDWWVGPADWVPPPKWSLPRPFPSPIPPQTVSNLILSQVNKGFGIPWPPAPSGNAAPGGEGVELGPAGAAATGQTSWKNFLHALERQEHVTIRLISAEERKQLVRMAWIEEELRKREVERNRERVGRQMRGETRKVIERRSVKRLVRSAMLGNREAIGELERRGIVSGEELARWKGIAERKGERMRKLNKEANPKKKKRSLFWPEGDEMKKTTKEAKETKEEEALVEVGGELAPAANGEVELEIVRVGPNPRLLICRYFDAVGEVRVGVRVKSIRSFRRGMKFRMVPNGGNGNPWEYEGKLPRFVGRW